MSATFRKNKQGEWVVFGPASVVRPGRVAVTKKDGRVQSVEIESVGRPFFANGQQMVYGYIAKKAPKSAPKVETAPESAQGEAEMDAELAAERAMALGEAGFDSRYADMF